MDLAIGFQSWVVREPLNEDFTGTLSKMAGMGYESIEMCSPVGYSRAGFAPLAKLKPKEMRGIINDAGLSCVSSHFTFTELNQDLKASIKFAKGMKLDHMIVSSFGVSEEAGLDEWKKAADVANELGKKTARAGIQLGFHNHNLEFEKREGQLIYDVLLDRLDPSLVKMQFQLWVVIAGYHAADYFRKHPDRFVSAHLYDWSGVGEERTPIGQGQVNWIDFFEAGKENGLKEIYVEMNPPLLKESAAFLKGMR